MKEGVLTELFSSRIEDISVNRRQSHNYCDISMGGVIPLCWRRANLWLNVLAESDIVSHLTAGYRHIVLKRLTAGKH